jgi:hypothetical protein
LRLGWGAGVAIAILLSLAAYFFGLVDLTHMVSLALLVVGLWTIGGALFVVERKDRNYYAGWGIVLAVLSSFAYLPLNYAIGLLLVAIVALILLYAYVGRTGKLLTAATNPPPAGGGRPAAS